MSIRSIIKNVVVKPGQIRFGLLRTLCMIFYYNFSLKFSFYVFFILFCMPAMLISSSFSHPFPVHMHFLQCWLNIIALDQFSYGDSGKTCLSWHRPLPGKMCMGNRRANLRLSPFPRQWLRSTIYSRHFQFVSELINISVEL